MATNEDLLASLMNEQPAPTGNVYRESSLTQRQPRQPASPRGVILSPIERRTVDGFAPWFWLAMGLVAFAITSVSTVTQSGEVIRRMQIALSSTQTLAVGLVLVALIFGGELITSDTWPKVYLGILFVDVAFTLSWSWSAFYNLLNSFSVPHLWAIGVSVLISTVISVLCAWLPERVLIGARRRGYL